jgi:glycosidase
MAINKGDAAIRQDFPAVGMAMQCIYKEGRTDKTEYFDFTAKLFTWRKSKTAIHTGKMTHYIPENVYAYFRYNNNETVMVLINKATTETKTIKPIDSKKTLRTSKQEKMLFLNLHLTLSNEIIIEPKSVLILELK